MRLASAAALGLAAGVVIAAPIIARNRGLAAARSDPGPGRTGQITRTETSMRRRFWRLWTRRARLLLRRCSARALTPRPDWPPKVEALGLDFHTGDNGEPYWWEAACYAFSAAEIDMIEEATETLHGLCLEAVDRLVADRRSRRVSRSPSLLAVDRESWRRRDPDVYGRFDLAYDGTRPPKMLEYNADTPTALLEAAVVQWYWLEEVKPGCDQFNSIHEKLIARWTELRAAAPDDRRACTSPASSTSRKTAAPSTTCATSRSQGGWPTEQLDIAEIGWNGARLHRPAERPIEALVQALPVGMDAARGVRRASADRLRRAVVEPPWKMLLSNKAILPVLWEMFPDHPNLLPAAFDARDDRRAHASKSRSTAARATTSRCSAAARPATAAATASTRPCAATGVRRLARADRLLGRRRPGRRHRHARGPRAVTTNASRFVPHYFS